MAREILPSLSYQVFPPTKSTQAQSSQVQSSKTKDCRCALTLFTEVQLPIPEDHTAYYDSGYYNSISTTKIFQEKKYLEKIPNKAYK